LSPSATRDPPLRLNPEELLAPAAATTPRGRIPIQAVFHREASIVAGTAGFTAKDAKDAKKGTRRGDLRQRLPDAVNY
jgi:hypothetical protein